MQAVSQSILKKTRMRHGLLRAVSHLVIFLIYIIYFILLVILKNNLFENNELLTLKVINRYKFNR